MFVLDRSQVLDGIENRVAKTILQLPSVQLAKQTYINDICAVANVNPGSTFPSVVNKRLVPLWVDSSI